jgi:predicted MFS family arabinose efflux permease
MSRIGYDRRGAWRAALACAVALGVAVGLGRFAFTPMLPIMLHEGKLDLQGGGVLASLNYLGYFVGALGGAAIHLKPAFMVRSGLVATAVLLAVMGLVQDFALWGALRAAAGVVSAWTFVFASGWGLRRLAETGAPALGGVIYAGPGIGIVATGLLGSALGRWGSEAGWVGFGLLSAVLIAVVWHIFSDREPALATPASPAPAPTATESAAVRSEARWLVVIYGLAGFGYIITATFLPVIARQVLPGSAWSGLFWPLLGLAVTAGALISARAPASWDNRLLLAGAYGLQALGIVVSIAWPTIVGFAIGSLLVGMPFTAISLFAMRDARRLRGNASARLIGYATASYGVGQILGPLFAAPLAQRTGSFTLPLLVAAGVLAAGAALFVHAWRRSLPAGGGSPA